MNIIEEVKQKSDIVEIVGQYTRLTRAVKTQGLMPLPQREARLIFIYPDQQRWHCFASRNEGGDVFPLS